MVFFLEMIYLFCIFHVRQTGICTRRNYEGDGSMKGVPTRLGIEPAVASQLTGWHGENVTAQGQLLHSKLCIPKGKEGGRNRTQRRGEHEVRT